MRRSLLVLTFLIALSPALHAQDRSAGASYTFLFLTYPDQIPHGFGGWLTWKFVDVGVNLFPDDHPIIGRQTQVQAGVRGGVRNRVVGVFGRARPGIIHFSERFFQPEIGCILIFPPLESCLIDATNLTLDLGGTIELYPSARSIIRIDIGDTLLRFARGQLDAVWKHNLQVAGGGGVRF